MRRILLAAAILALAACSTERDPAPSAPTPPSNAASPPQPPASAPVEPADNPDACGASRYQNLVGKPRSEVPVPVDPRKQRVACTTCPVTMDHSPERLNFFFDAATGIIKEVRCG